MSERGNISRRDLLSAAGVAGLVGLSAGNVDAQAVGDTAAELAERRQAAQRLRCDLAREYSHHPTNGDYEEYSGANGLPRRLWNYSKGPKHDDKGEVDPGAYMALRNALQSGDPVLFDRIPLGGDTAEEPVSSRLRSAKLLPDAEEEFYRYYSERQTNYTGSKTFRLTNPQAGLAFDPVGADSHELVVPPPPRFDSEESIAEIAENYWMAITRDIPFAEYEQNATVAKAAEDLSGYEQFLGPNHAASLKLGEQVALQFLREAIQTYNEPVSTRVTKFDATQDVYTNSH
jgi:hypothetical protein